MTATAKQDSYPEGYAPGDEYDQSAARRADSDRDLRERRAREDRVRRIAKEKGYQAHKDRGGRAATWSLHYTSDDYPFTEKRSISVFGLTLTDAERWIETVPIEDGYNISDAWYRWFHEYSAEEADLSRQIREAQRRLEEIAALPSRWVGYDFTSALDEQLHS